MVRNGVELNLPQSQQHSCNISSSIIYTPFNSVPVTALTTSQVFSVLLQPGQYTMEHLYIELTVTNLDTANSAFIRPTPLWISQLQISGNAGGTIIQNWADGMQLMLDTTAFWSNTEQDALSEALNIAPADNPISNPGPGYAIPPAGTTGTTGSFADARANPEFYSAPNTRRYYLYIPGFWEQCPFPMSLITGPIQIQITTAPSCLDTPPQGVIPYSSHNNN